MIGRKNTTAVLFTCFVAGALPSQAATHEEIVESCRQSVGRPIVQACMGGRRDMLEECRKKATPAVRACVIKEEQRIAATKAAPAAAKDKEEEAALKGDRGAVAAGFVAPPRTIADITAILDSEKPHPATLAKLKASAENEPGKNISQTGLAEFYVDRGTARSALGRNMDALADGEKALAAALASGDGYFGQRIRQFITLQKLAMGDIKGALQISQFMIKDANRPGQKGYLFNAQRIAANILVQMGDIPQAEGYMRQSLALLQEARTSGMPGWRTGYTTKGRAWEADVEAIRAT